MLSIDLKWLLEWFQRQFEAFGDNIYKINLDRIAESWYNNIT